jgi:hypothetical protein
MRFNLCGRIIAICFRDPLEEVALSDRILLGANCFDDIRRQERADLGAAFIAKTPSLPGQETRAKGVTNTGWIGL